MNVPADTKIYHIVHIDRLPSIIAQGCLWSDSEQQQKDGSGTVIGMPAIKLRRLQELILSSYPELHVGDCVPFYFCPRSVRLFMISKGNNPELPYTGGQSEVIHLEADFQRVIAWAQDNQRRWAFTDGNAGTRFFNDWADPARLDQLNWDAIYAQDWRDCKESKQAEFLLERRFPLSLVDSIGVYDTKILGVVESAVNKLPEKPSVQIRKEWYY